MFFSISNHESLELLDIWTVLFESLIYILDFKSMWRIVLYSLEERPFTLIIEVVSHYLKD
jgi:hypothetical protein